MKSIGILTTGGDAPGLNAVVRAVVKSIHRFPGDWRAVGYVDGFAGAATGEVIALTEDVVSGSLRRGGTLLGAGPRWDAATFQQQAPEIARRLSRHDAVVVIGGNGSMQAAFELSTRYEVPIIGVPKTIDNDVAGTDVTFGFDSAVSFATDAIDRLHPTADAHQRVMVVEVMGRDVGHLALHAGVAGGADVILIPEIPFRVRRVREAIHQRDLVGKRQSIVVVAEGVVHEDKGAFARMAGTRRAYGGVGQWLANKLAEQLAHEVRCVQLGHLQRGGEPTAQDRALATMFGAEAAAAAARSDVGVMVRISGGVVGTAPLLPKMAIPRPVDIETDPMVAAARRLGIRLGD